MTMNVRVIAIFLLATPMLCRAASAQTSDLDPRVVKLVAAISEERLGDDSEEARELRDAKHALVDDIADSRHRRGARSGSSRR